MDCIFCSIISGEIPSAKVWEDEFCYAFKDIHPQAKVHIVIVPKAHIESADKIYSGNSVYISKIFEAIPQIAAAAELGSGYRVVTNVGEHGCQSVKHLHFHILGGEQLPENIGA